MKSLFLITARGGSKGIPHKNIKPLAGKPLISAIAIFYLYKLITVSIMSHGKLILSK